MLIKARWLQAVFFTALTFGQTMIDLRTQSKSVDFSAANTTKPMKAGTVLPSTCGVGEMFYLTSAAPGTNVYGCVTQNAWSLESGSTLPSVSGNSGSVLTTDGTIYLWSSLGGDVSGAPGALTVTQLQGLPLTAGTPTTGQILTWTGTAWSGETAPPSGSTLPSETGNTGKLLTTNGTNYLWTGLAGDVSGAPSAVTVTQLQGLPVTSGTPASGQILTWTGTAWAAETAPPAGSTLPSETGNTGKLLTTNGTNYLWTGLAGDVSGAPGAVTVTQLQGLPVTSGTPASGQILTWTGTAWAAENVPAGNLPSETGNAGKLLTTDGTSSIWTGLAGDVSGAPSAVTVTQLQGLPVTSGTPDSGQILTWTGTAWAAENVPAGNLPSETGNAGKLLATDGTNSIWTGLAGDVSGAPSAVTVTQLQGLPLTAGTPASGQILTWTGTAWAAENVPAGNLPSETGNAGKLLTTDGTNSTWSGLGGDVSGAPSAVTVKQLQGLPVTSGTPTSGQILTWSGTAWAAANAPPAGSTLPSETGNSGKLLTTNGTNYLWTSLGGDLSGTPSAATVTQLQGLPLTAGTPTSGQILTWSGTAWAAANAPPAGSTLPSETGNSGKVLTTNGTNYLWSSLGGDLSGTPSAATVTQLQGLPLTAGTPTSGQILTWSGTSWAAANAPAAGSTLPSVSGNAGKVLTTDGTNSIWAGLGGDLSGAPSAATVTQLQGLPLTAGTPTTGQILTWTGSAWAAQNAPSGGTGSGATMASQLGDFLVTRTSATTLAIGANCSAATPCNARFGGLLYAFTSGATVSVNSGTGFAFIYVTSAGTLTVGSGLGLTCSGCILQSGITATPPDSIALFFWSATNGSWAATGVDQRAFLSYKEVTGGTGISVAPDSQGHTVISADPNVVPLRTSAPATSTSACTPGSWANDTSYFYLCVNQNQWLRAALASF